MPDGADLRRLRHRAGATPQDAARAVGAATVARLASDLQDPGMPPEINRLGRTIWRWRRQISNWHTARVTNAAAEAANNPAKRVKRAAFGY